MIQTEVAAAERRSVAYLERVVLALVQARRSLQLYPRANPLVRASLEKLANTLESADSPDDVRACEIRAEGFFAGDTQLCMARADVVRFALLLYRDGAKLLRVEAGASLSDATDFLEAVLAVEEGKADGRTRAQLGKSFIRLEFFEEAVIAQRQGDAQEEQEEGDALSYFMAQRKRRGVLAKAGGHLHDVLSFLMAAEQGQGREQMMLLNTLSDPEKFAGTLSYVTHGDGDEGGEVSTKIDNALQQTFHHIDASLKEYPEEFREDIVQSMAEGVISTDAGTREKVLNTVLPAELGHGGIEDAMTRTLPPRTISSVLMRHIQIHDGTASTIQGFVDTLADSKRDRVMASFQESIEALPAQAKNERVEEVQRVLTAQLNAKKGGSAPCPPVDALEERQRVLAERAQQTLQFSQEEAMSVRLRVAEESERADTQHDMLVFFYLFALGSLEGEKRMFEMLQNTLQQAMEDRHFDFVNLIIKIALGNVRSDVREDAFPTLQAYLLSLYGGEGMKGFMGYLTQLAKVDPESVNETLEAIAPKATPALFHRLETEGVKQARFDVLNILVEIGPAGMDFLRHQVQHAQWYVVRNAVFLLGRLPHEGNVPYLEMAINHIDARVRLEAVKALGSTPGGRAVQVVARGLQDRDAGVRELVIETLARLGDASHAAEIVELLDREGRAALRQPDYAMALLQAVAKLSGPEASPSLKRFLWRTWLPGTQQRPKLRATCRFALSQVKQRAQREESTAIDDTVAGR